MKFFSNKIFLQDAPKTFGDLCKEASASRAEEMTKVASAEDAMEKTAEEGIPAELTEALEAIRNQEGESGDLEDGAIGDIEDEIVGEVEDEIVDGVEDVFAGESSDKTLKVASIEPNEDGSVTVEFGKTAMELLCNTCNEDPCQCEEECDECLGEGNMIEEACSYANDFGKFIKVSNLTGTQKDYFKNYWNSVWPEEFISALLIDQ